VLHQRTARIALGFRNFAARRGGEIKLAYMGDGRWAMGDGRWAMGDGRWAMVADTTMMSSSFFAFFAFSISIYHCLLQFFEEA
jgi:hypothetical protein